MRNFSLKTGLIAITIMSMMALTGEGMPSDHQQPVNDTVLHRIQQKIDEAFVRAQMRNDVGQLNLIRSLLSERASDRWATYWLGYAYYNEAIYYLTLKNNEKSKETIHLAIDLLDGIKEKNSEDYALLALLQSFSIKFISGMQAGVVSSRVKKNAKQAIKMDDKNLRAYYVYGSNDFYTPEQYGGGAEAEEYLKKAISIDAQYKDDPTSPTWGKNPAYEILIRFYIKRGDKTSAKKYYDEAIVLFPNDYQIKQLAKKME